MNLPGNRQTTLGIWLSSYDPITSKPGDTSSTKFRTCRICVPFKHRLLRALMTSTNIDNIGVLGASVEQADPGDANTGTLVGTALTDAQLADADNLLSVSEFTLAASDKAEAPANRCYQLKLDGSNGNDRIAQPTLMLLVQPVGRVAL